MKTNLKTIPVEVAVGTVAALFVGAVAVAGVVILTAGLMSYAARHCPAHLSHHSGRGHARRPRRMLRVYQQSSSQPGDQQPTAIFAT